MNNKQIEYCSCGGMGLGKVVIIDGVEYIQCAHCLKPIRGSGKVANRRTSK